MKNRNVVVGVFVVAGFTLFTIGLFLIGNRHEAFARHVEYYTEFSDLSGVTKGTKVQVAGMDAGEVLDVSVPSTPASPFRVRLRINNSFHGLVRTDSVTTIGTEGVVGDTFLLIRPGSAQAAVASAGTTLPSKEPTDMADLIEQGKSVLANVDHTVGTANGVLSSVGTNLNTTLDTVRGTVGNVNGLVVNLRAGRGPAGMLLNDEAVGDQIRLTVSNAQQATVNLNRASEQANRILSDIDSRELPQKVDDAIVSVRSAANNIDVGSLQLRQTISDATRPDSKGVTAGANIRESLSNANLATANIADDSEALKHNLLLKGFFRRRGYFDLAHLSPEKYESNKSFSSSGNKRIWLTSDQIFTPDSNGVERLTTQGKILLDDSFARYADVIDTSAIVIEGYGEGSDADEQLVRARNRAIAVRLYLLAHFQLDASQVGIVALKSSPPTGVDHATWDGVCIVLLASKP